MGKSENYLFLETIAALGLKVAWSKVTQISKLKIVFLKNSGEIRTKAHMKA